MQAAEAKPKHGEVHGQPARVSETGQFICNTPSVDVINSGSHGPLFDQIKPEGKPPAKKQLASQQGGTGAAYLAAKIKRDRPDIAAAVERGEYPSMRAAATMQAGVIKREYIQIDKADPARAAATIKKHCDGPACTCSQSPTGGAGPKIAIPATVARLQQLRRARLDSTRTNPRRPAVLR